VAAALRPCLAGPRGSLSSTVSAQTALFIGGALSEFFGIVFLAFPDLLPGARRASAWLARTARTVEGRVRRLLRLPGRKHYVSLSSSLSVESAMSGSVIVGPKRDATPDELLEFLVRRDRETQQHINALSQRLSDFERSTPEELELLRERMESHVADELAAAAQQYRSLRVAGTFALAAGLFCVTLANFV
jgi:hypothetical protein